MIAVKGAIRYLPRADSWITCDVNRRCIPFMLDRRPGVHYYAAVPREFGTRMSRIEAHKVVLPGITYLRRGHGHGLPTDTSLIHTGNSSWAALQLAWHMGAKQIALLGVDGTPFGYAMDPGSPRGSLNQLPILFASAAPTLEAAGVQVVTGSERSNVFSFPRTTPDEALFWISGETMIEFAGPVKGPTALILGGSDKVWQEARMALELFEPDAIFAIKDMIEHWPGRIDYAISLHPERLKDQALKRAANGYPFGYQTWSHQKMRGGNPRGAPLPDVDKVMEDWAGSSGLFAVQVALQQGFKKIVLAGIPMDGTGNHFIRRRQWQTAHQFAKAWRKHSNALRGRVRSMSGWTADEFGRPNREWLAQG